MSKKELAKYQACASQLLSQVRQLEKEGHDINDIKKLLRALIEALKERDYSLADYLIQLIEKQIESYIKLDDLTSRLSASEAPIKPFKHGKTLSKSVGFRSYLRTKPKKRLMTKATAALVVLVLIFSTMGVASAQSLPDSRLYSAKIALEKVKTFLILTPQGKAKYQMRLAEERIKESQVMIERGHHQLAKQALGEADKHVQASLNWAQLANDNQVTYKKLKKEKNRLKKKKSQLSKAIALSQASQQTKEKVTKSASPKKSKKKTAEKTKTTKTNDKQKGKESHKKEKHSARPKQNNKKR
jgi:hypothetical protein